MSELLTILVLITAFGGLSLVGVAILVSGLVAAERTSSVIWCAAVAATLFAIQLGWIGFWHSFGVGFGGEGRTGAAILQWGAVAAVALVGGFLALKLPPAVGKVVETARWWDDGARISAFIIVAYVLYLAGGVLLRWAYPPGGRIAAPSLAPWLIAAGGVVLAVGLWRHRAWAWWGALACAVYAIARILWFAYPHLLSDLPFLFRSTPVGIRLLLLVALVGVLLFSNARRLCLRG